MELETYPGEQIHMTHLLEPQRYYELEPKG